MSETTHSAFRSVFSDHLDLPGGVTIRQAEYGIAYRVEQSPIWEVVRSPEVAEIGPRFLTPGGEWVGSSVPVADSSFPSREEAELAYALYLLTEGSA